MNGLLGTQHSWSQHFGQSNSNVLGEFVRLRHPSFVTSTMSSMRTAPRPDSKGRVRR